MGKALEIIGWLIMIGVMAVMVFIASRAPNNSVIYFMLPWAIPSIIGGLLVAAFGRMLQELQSTREQAERQSMLLDEIASSTRKPTQPIFGRE